MWSYLSFLGVLRWLDLVEIALFTGIIYRFGCWLKRDRAHFLLGYFYVASLLFLCAFMLDLHTVIEFYRVSWPILIVLFIIFHQKSLQQNYVAARTIEPIKIPADAQWLHMIMCAAFKALQRKKNIIFIIQGKQRVDEYLTETVVMHSPITQPLLDMLIESTVIQDQRIIVLSQTGILCIFNSQWRTTDTIALTMETNNLNAQQKQTLLWTGKSDALAFFIHPETKRVTILAQGTIVADLTNEKAELIITQFIRKQNIVSAARMEKIETFAQKNN